MRLGQQDDYMPDWLGDFAIAEVLRIPVADVPKQSLRMLYRARTVIEARQKADEMRRGAT